MNLLQLLEAAEDNQLKSWSSSLGINYISHGGIYMNIHFQGSHALSDVLVDLDDPSDSITTVTGGLDIFKLIHMNISDDDYGSSFGSRLKKLQEYLQAFLKKPNAKELMIQFAQNVFAQFVATGGERGNYRYALPLPKDDEIIRGVLKIYKKLNGKPDSVLSVLGALQRMGYKLPRDVLVAIQKSAKAQGPLDDV